MKRTSGWLSPKEYRYIYRRVPRLVVDLVIRRRQAVLLAKRDITPDRGKWHLPGGRVRLGERLEDAARRIAYEETGLEVKIGQMLGIIQYASRGLRDLQSVGIVFPAGHSRGMIRGSRLGKTVAFHTKAPRPLVREHRAFLLKYHLLRF